MWSWNQFKLIQTHQFKEQWTIQYFTDQHLCTNQLIKPIVYRLKPTITIQYTKHHSRTYSVYSVLYRSLPTNGTIQINTTLSNLPKNKSITDWLKKLKSSKILNFMVMLQTKLLSLITSVPHLGGYTHCLNFENRSVWHLMKWRNVNWFTQFS